MTWTFNFIICLLEGDKDGGDGELFRNMFGERERKSGEREEM